MYHFRKVKAVLTLGLTAFLMTGMHSEAMEEAYREPALSGPTETWIYQGDTLDSGRNRILADDQEDGDLTTKIQSSGTVNTSKTGTYTLSSQVTDSDGHVTTMTTTVKVLDPNTATDSEKTVKRTLYTLPDASYLTDIGFNRGYYHDRQNLGIWIPEGKTLKVRLVNGSDFGQDLTLQFSNNDSATETVSVLGSDQNWTEPAESASIPASGEWVTIESNYLNEDGSYGSADSVPFIITPKDTTVQPVIEIAWSDDYQDIPYYRYGDDQEDFFADWDESQAPYAIIEGDAATFLVPLCDRNRIVNYSGVREEYQFHSIDEMLEWYAAFVKQYDAYAGLSFDAEEPYNQNVRAKFFIKVNNSGAGAAYYTTDHSAQNGLYSDGSLAGYLTKDWLSLHEFGHGYEGAIASQENTFVETTNNIMGYYFEPTYRAADDFGWLLSGFNYSTLTERFNALGARAAARRAETSTFAGIINGALHYDVSLFMFTNVLDKLGPEKTVAAMHTQYRKYYYENQKNTSSSDVIAESYSVTGGYNVIPYFEGWYITPSEQVKKKIYDMDLPMIYYLKDLIPDEKECESVRAHLGLDGIYSLVSTDELAYTGYTSTVKVDLSIDDLDQIKGKKIRIKNGSNVVKELTITSTSMETELPVGIYEVELPSTKNSGYTYEKEYLVASKGSAAKTFTYKKVVNPLADDMEMQLLGLSDSLVATVSVDTARNVLNWTVEGGTPHVYIEGTYISIRVLDPFGKEIFSQTLNGTDEVEDSIREISFPVGSKLEIYHYEASTRLKMVSTYTGDELKDYSLSENNLTTTYVMTDKGLMQSDWSEEKQMLVYENVLESYSDALLGEMTTEDLNDSEQYANEKTTLKLAYEKLDEEAKQAYEDAYGVLIGKESSTSYGYTMIDSSRLKGSADSEQGGAEGAASALDQNTDTIWHTNYTGGTAADLAAGTNCTYTILLDQNTDIGKLEYVPRQDGGSNGIILSYRLFYSTTATGENFQEISIKDNTWSYDDDTKSVTFVAENARRIRIMAVTTAPDDQFISAAEFRLYEQYKIATPATYLSDLYLSATKEIKKDQDKSFTLPADTTVTVDLEGKDLDYFQAQAAGADTSGAVLKIYGDGNLLYTSDALKTGSDAENIFLQVTGIKELKFQTTGSVSLADARFKQKEDHTSLSLYEGESVSVLANGTLTPENRGVITWTSENTAVATVSKEGVVTAVGEGSTRILASYGTETLVCTVTVKKVPETKASAVEKNTSSGQQNTVSQTEKNTEKKETTTTTVTKPKKVTIKKVKAGKKKATVTWQKVTGASGYEVWMKTGSGAFKKVKSLSAKKTSLTVKKLKAGKKYTFKVRAYKKGADGKKVYGAYSKKKTIKI